MWSGHEFVFMGLILVGIGLTIRVVIEGHRETAALKHKLEQFRVASDRCQTKMEQVLAKVQKLTGEVLGLKQEFQAIDSRKGHLEKKVGLMKKRLERK
jgi:predicted  nucleic acid-binding Zn-ribbon protein